MFRVVKLICVGDKGVIIKRTVGALESIFGAPFWANRKSADPASAEKCKLSIKRTIRESLK